MTLLMNPDEKAELAARANVLGISASELVRRAVQSYDPDDDMDELKALADELAGAAGRMEKKLDATLAKVAAYERALADKDGLKAAARAELEASGISWPFDRSEEDEPARASV
jgi:hypothetical protein